MDPEEKAKRFRELGAHSNHPFMESLATRRDLFDPACPLSLRIVLASPERGMPKLEIDFEGVVDLKIGNLNLVPGIVLDVKCVRKRQLENIAFQVEEIGRDYVISFFCANFSWRILEAADE